MKKAIEHNYKAGDIFRRTFGYSMTINDFYQVIETTPKTITLHRIGKKWVGGEVGFTGNVSPIKNDFQPDTNFPPAILKRKPVRQGGYVVAGGDYLYPTTEGSEHYENHLD